MDILSTSAVQLGQNARLMTWLFMFIMDSRGIGTVLVGMREVRMVSGCKSNVKDCQWLQRQPSAG